MYDNHRTKPLPLLLFETLQPRMMLSTKEERYCQDLEKGFEGEQHFDNLIHPMINQNHYVLKDLLLKHNQATFQLDSVLISSDTAHLFEIKNFTGDHVYKMQKFYRLPDTVLVNPLHQLQRAESLFSQLLKKLGYSLKVESHIIFVNPSFMLYQAPLDQPIVYPSQIKHFLESIIRRPSHLTPRHKRLVEQLQSLHNSKPPLRYIPDYDFDSLRKGVCCVGCQSLSQVSEGRFCICVKCNTKELFSSAVMRAVQEFKLLFPNQKIKTRVIYEWCGRIGSTKRIQKVLMDHLTKKGAKQGAYYE